MQTMHAVGALEPRSPGDDNPWGNSEQFSPSCCRKMQVVSTEVNSQYKSITMAQANAFLVYLPSISWWFYRSAKKAFLNFTSP